MKLKVSDFHSKMIINGQEMSCNRIDEYLSKKIATEVELNVYCKSTKLLVHKEELSLILSYNTNNKGEKTVVIRNLNSGESCCINYFKKGQGHCLCDMGNVSTTQFLNNHYQLALEDSSKKEQENQIIFAFILGTLL